MKKKIAYLPTSRGHLRKYGWQDGMDRGPRFIEWKSLLAEEDIDLRVVDEFEDWNEVDLFIFENWYDYSFEIYEELVKLGLVNRCCFYMSEMDVVLSFQGPENLDNIHRYFPMLGTYRKDFLDKSWMYELFPADIFDESLQHTDVADVAFSDRKLMVNMSGNKTSKHPNEIYSERVKVLKWFEANHPEDLDMYGPGWGPEYKTYKGLADDKLGTYKGYKFALCLENTRNEAGYITEKIIDCLLAGLVPIYWGAPDIVTTIPFDCYVKYWEFESTEALYQYISTMSEERWQRYIDEAKRFMESEASDWFRTKTMVSQVKIMLENIERYKDFTVSDQLMDEMRSKIKKGKRKKLIDYYIKRILGLVSGK